MELSLYYPVKNLIDEQNLFGAKSPMYTNLNQLGHPGVDFECPMFTPIYAPCDGDAFYVYDKYGGDGLWIRVPNNAQPSFNIILYHMVPRTDAEHPFSIPTTPGTITPVKAGQLLGYSGDSGFPVESTGPHLHLGIMPSDSTGGPLNGSNGYLGCVDPMPFFNGKYAQDIATEQQVVEKAASVVSLVSQATDQQIPHAEKISILEAIEQFLKSLLP